MGHGWKCERGSATDDASHLVVVALIGQNEVRLRRELRSRKEMLWFSGKFHFFLHLVSEFSQNARPRVTFVHGYFGHMLRVPRTTS